MEFRLARAGSALHHFLGLAVVSGACCWSVQAQADDSSRSALSASPDQPAEQAQSAQAEDTEHSPVRFGFLAQARADIVDDTVDGRTTYHPEAWLHRVRPTLRVATTNGSFVSFVQINVLPDALYLVDLWADVRLSDWLQLRAGQLKVPFTRYRSMSVGRLTLVNWPITAAAFGAEWQMGVMLHNGGGPSPKSAADIDYAVGVFMGAARTSAFATGVADSHGRAVPNHSDLTDPAIDTTVHPELIVRIGQGSAAADGQDNSDSDGGAARHHMGLSLAWDAAPEPGRDFALRCSPEVLLKVHGLVANAVSYLGFTKDRQVVVPAMLGGHLELAWRRSVYEVVARHARVHYLQPLKQAAARDLQGRLGEASDAERESLEQQLFAIEPLKFETETLAGFNFYATDSFKLQLDGGLATTHGERLERAWIARSQLQFKY